ncbi:hypothetical protein [Patulibacter sp. SYSU D01012]|uniref:hypothetical protein n=1 Tax=Patulibacter sp. SYSU D01012 TaxID=2817381 RepID=UPI001B314C65|nr:hypothetical protein [Patulibacter sp. SYSU D01012]
MFLSPLSLALSLVSVPAMHVPSLAPDAVAAPVGHVRAPASGPGRLLAYPLIYRGRPKDGRRDRYIVFFRTRGPFAGRDSVGTTHPGELRVEDAFDNHDGFGGAISAGHPRGKCYTWHLGTDQATPVLDAAKIGAKVSYRFALRKTRKQSGTATLRLRPSAQRLERDLRSIGC